MGCPNWKEDKSYKSTAEVQGSKNIPSGSGVIMVAHVGCGTWTKRLPDMLESQSWDSLPLSALFNATTDAKIIGDKEILLLPKCCGSLCKYLMVASGRASVFILQATAQKLIKAWDHAVGVICVQEAGGKVGDCNWPISKVA
ncbi:hypothetical protein Patl1_10903 [Pistacia atlantica]|uniref:Uncharacterized protein n=1 Tax=Pistacia atlantica TaxID=434234 RepID=A0ACC1AB54_9ROSI|nr:hypothetical protein Patl1_10903 [Pistacia atlantica]